MKQPIRYFSIGLLTASLIILIFISFFEKDNGNVSESTVDEMIDTLKDDGYHVLSSSEYITLSVATEQKDDETDKDEKDSNTKNEEDENDLEKEDKSEENTDDTEAVEPEVHQYKLKIKENMLGPTVSQLLKENNIIDDVDEFNRYLEKEGYAPYLQLGEHDVSSDMSHFEIAEEIARKR